MRLNSISVKVLIAYVAGVVLSMVLFALGAVAVATSQGDVLSGRDVAALTADMAEKLAFNGDGVPVGFDHDEDGYFSWLYESLRQETAYRVMDSSGVTILHSAAGVGFWPATGAAIRLERGRFEFSHEGVAMRAATVAVEQKGRVWFLQNAVSARFLNLSYRAFALPFTIAGILLFSMVLLVVFGACAYVTLKFTLKPLREISEAAAAISPRSLDARLQAQAMPAEIAPLVESFNRVLERLEQGYRVQRDFLATAAHELKTPLALIRAQIEVADGGGRKDLLGDVEHMTRQVQQLLLLAEASEGRNYSFAIVDVRQVAEEAAIYLKRMADAADVRVVVDGDVSGAQWLADKGALFTLFKNLLENAIQHAPRATEVGVEVGASSVAVRDWGPGVEPEQLPRIFSRFWRGAHRRDHGAGLGLAIAQEISLAHGWSLSAQRAEPGLRVILSRTPEMPGSHSSVPSA